jgi:hypothetical protein
MNLASVSWDDGLLVGGTAWPPHQLPPATGCPSAAAARLASATCHPGLGGLMVPVGDALLGQGLAKPGVLVVHGPSPFFRLSRIGCCWLALSMAMRRARRIRQVPYAGAGLLPISGCWAPTTTGPLRQPRGIPAARWAAAWRARPWRRKSLAASLGLTCSAVLEGRPAGLRWSPGPVRVGG